MEKLSETLKELGIAFKFPIKIKDSKGNVTYFEGIYGIKQGTPRSQTCEGKVVEINEIKYELKLK